MKKENVALFLEIKKLNKNKNGLFIELKDLPISF